MDEVKKKRGKILSVFVELLQVHSSVHMCVCMIRKGVCCNNFIFKYYTRNDI